MIVPYISILHASDTHPSSDDIALPGVLNQSHPTPNQPSLAQRGGAPLSAPSGSTQAQPQKSHHRPPPPPIPPRITLSTSVDKLLLLRLSQSLCLVPCFPLIRSVAVIRWLPANWRFGYCCCRFSAQIRSFLGTTGIGAWLLSKHSVRSEIIAATDWMLLFFLSTATLSRDVPVVCWRRW